MTEKILENLRMAHKIISATPEDAIDLQQFTTSRTCGTLHCAGGWLATVPYFQALGLGLVGGRLRVGGSEASGYVKLDPLLGDSAFDRLFCEYGGGAFDGLTPEIADFCEQNDCEADDVLGVVEGRNAEGQGYELPISHKALALKRIEMQIAAVGSA